MPSTPAPHKLKLVLKARKSQLVHLVLPSDASPQLYHPKTGMSHIITQVHDRWRAPNTARFENVVSLNTICARLYIKRILACACCKPATKLAATLQRSQQHQTQRLLHYCTPPPLKNVSSGTRVSLTSERFGTSKVRRTAAMSSHISSRVMNVKYKYASAKVRAVPAASAMLI